MANQSPGPLGSDRQNQLNQDTQSLIHNLLLNSLRSNFNNNTPIYRDTNIDSSQVLLSALAASISGNTTFSPNHPSPLQHASPSGENASLIVAEGQENAQAVKLIDTPDSNIQRVEVASPTKKRQREDEVETTSTNTYLPRNYVYQVLKNNDEGDFLLAAYHSQSKANNEELLLEKKKCLYFTPGNVAKILVFHEFKRTNSFVISSERMEALARDCTELFPSYLKENFYYPANKKSAGGAIYQAYISQREKEIAVGRIPVDEVVQERKNQRKINVQNNAWLKEWQAPVSIIDDNYKLKWDSFDLKAKLKWYNDNKLIDIFEKLSSLTLTNGYELIEQDFYASQEISQDIFMENWTKLSQHVISLGKKANLPDSLKDLLPSVKDTSNQNSESMRSLALLVLPYIFKRTTKIPATKSTEAWSPTYDEISISFITYIKSTDNVETSLAEIREKLLEIYNKRKLSLQPYIVVFGENVDTIKKSFVILGPHTYELCTPSEAVDLLYKASIVFKKDFARACNHIWQFLENQVYERDTSCVYSNVTAVIRKLKALMANSNSTLVLEKSRVPSD